MNVLSLFDGISCGRVALERVGLSVDNYFASEIDKWAIRVSRANWPEIQQLGDVRSVHAKDLPKIDLLIGGSPCQGFSFAGKMLNFDDPRSALFFEYVRILNELRQQNPNVLFLLENVPMKREWQMTISKYLGVEPIEIDANLVSAQDRKRLFWTNIKAVPFNLFGDVRSNISQPKDLGILLADVLQSKIEVEEKYFLSEKSTVRMLRRNGSFNTRLNGEKACTILATSHKCRSENFISNDFPYIEQTARGFNKGGKKALNGKVPSVSANSWEHNNHLGGYRRLTPIEVERLFTLPDNYTAAVSDSQRYRLLGNAWVVDQVAHILKHIEHEENQTA